MNKWWGLFWFLGIVWGSSFLFIRIGVQEMDQYQVVFTRTAIAAIGLNITLALRGKHLPLDWNSLRPLIIIGLGNVVVPFLLITWGEKSVESGLASVLQSTAALFSVLLAHFAFHDERFTLQKIVGVIVGFVGVVVLASRSWASGQVVTSDLLGQLAIVVASLFYAIFTIYGKRMLRSQVEPLMIAAGSITTGAVVSGILMIAAPLWGGKGPVAYTDLSSDALIAVGLLGFLNTFLAYLVYYPLVQHLGVAKTSMVTYVVPVVGLVLGAIFLEEVVDARLLFGAALIFAGIGVVNVRLSRRSEMLAADVPEAG